MPREDRDRSAPGHVVVAGRVGLSRAGAGLALAGVALALGAGAIVVVERNREAQHTAATHRARDGAAAVLASRITRLNQRTGIYAQQLLHAPANASPSQLTTAASADFPHVALATPGDPLQIQ